MNLWSLVLGASIIIFVIFCIIFVLNEIQNAKYEKKKKKLENLAFKDKMTGCYNRNWLEEHRAEFDTKEMDIALVDLNGLKETNDKYGHEIGDRRIKIVADLLKNYGTVIRLGGDEFVVIFDSGKGMAFDTCFKCKNNTEFSFGMCYKLKENTFGEALKIADKRMYKMKKGERNNGNDFRKFR